MFSEIKSSKHFFLAFGLSCEDGEKKSCDEACDAKKSSDEGCDAATEGESSTECPRSKLLLKIKWLKC